MKLSANQQDRFRKENSSRPGVFWRSFRYVSRMNPRAMESCIFMVNRFYIFDKLIAFSENVPVFQHVTSLKWWHGNCDG